MEKRAITQALERNLLDKRDLCTQLDQILATRPDLIHQTMADFEETDPESAQVVRQWADRNNAKLSSTLELQLAGNPTKR